MRNLLQSFILSLALFTIDVLSRFVNSIFQSNDFGYYGFWGGVIYGLVFGLWVYWLLSYIYVSITKNDIYRKTKYLKSSVIVFIGYIASRVPDIIDAHFIEKFKLPGILVFILFVPLLVEMETFLRRLKSQRSI